MTNGKFKIVYEKIYDMDDVLVPKLIPIQNEKDAGRKRSLRTIFLFAIFFISIFSFLSSRAGSTVSYFNDTELSAGNIFSAGLLQFTVTWEGSNIAHVSNGSPGTDMIIPPPIPIEESLPMAYKISIEQFAGSDLFCQALQAKASTTPLFYEGPLLSLSTPTTTDHNHLMINLQLPDEPDGVLNGDVCYFNVVYAGWVEGTNGNGGYSDTKKLPVRLSAEIIIPEEEIDVSEFESLLIASSTDEYDSASTTDDTKNTKDDDISTTTEDFDLNMLSGGGSVDDENDDRDILDEENGEEENEGFDTLNFEDNGETASSTDDTGGETSTSTPPTDEFSQTSTTTEFIIGTSTPPLPISTSTSFGEIDEDNFGIGEDQASTTLESLGDDTNVIEDASEDNSGIVDDDNNQETDGINNQSQAEEKPDTEEAGNQNDEVIVPPVILSQEEGKAVDDQPADE